MQDSPGVHADPATGVSISRYSARGGHVELGPTNGDARIGRWYDGDYTTLRFLARSLGILFDTATV